MHVSDPLSRLAKRLKLPAGFHPAEVPAGLAVPALRAFEKVPAGGDLFAGLYVYHFARADSNAAGVEVIFFERGRFLSRQKVYANAAGLFSVAGVQSAIRNAISEAGEKRQAARREALRRVA